MVSRSAPAIYVLQFLPLAFLRPTAHSPMDGENDAATVKIAKKMLATG
jgi:hypothetical protein